MRRLPVYLLLDVSGSMHGEPIGAVKNGVKMLIDALVGEPDAAEIAHVSVITFADRAQQIQKLTAVSDFDPPELVANGQTDLGAALKLVAECADQEIVKSTPEKKGDFRPQVFIMTDGAATCPIDEGLAEFRKRKWATVVACGAGPYADTDELKKITETVLYLSQTNSAAIGKLFQYLSTIAVSKAKSVGSGENLPEKLPDAPEEIEIL